MINELNRRSLEIITRLQPIADELRIAFCSERRLVDFGVDVRGGLQAGLHLAEICMGGLGQVNLIPGSVDRVEQTLVQVFTDQPAVACMGVQYGGWPVKTDNYFAIGSGPIRLRRGKEAVLEKYHLSADSDEVVGVLESGKLPDDSVFEYVADECGLPDDRVVLCIAPTRSLAGTMQIVARSVEATMHKLFELDVDIRKVTSGMGTAPLPPVSADDMIAIGRTNDAILYGGRVTLWVDLSDNEIKEIGPRTPSNSSPDFGKPFAEIFAASGGDFYKLDPMLFSAAEITLVSNITGNRFRFGAIKAENLKFD